MGTYLSDLILYLPHHFFRFPSSSSPSSWELIRWLYKLNGGWSISIMSRNQTEEKNDGGVFNLTQQGDGRLSDMKKEIQELEQLLAGTNQVCGFYIFSCSIQGTIQLHHRIIQIYHFMMLHCSHLYTHSHSKHHTFRHLSLHCCLKREKKCERWMSHWS